ncbi:hypothetical protein [Pseudomonas sp. KCJK9016]|uniref:hypothetical protein n=1 Tax=Pseudomonas sp. KCJK9016 TaxID=3344556 RepID=UPI0039068F56
MKRDFETNTPEKTGLFTAEVGAEYCTATVQRHAPTQVVFTREPLCSALSRDLHTRCRRIAFRADLFRVTASQFFHPAQPPTKLQSSPINLREWINRLWALCGKPIRVKKWFRLNVWIKRLPLKNPVATGMGGRLSGCWC